MDELLIEDKKYISSKQAAKVTGYAKDYIGQLCREGRVPARLVGRAWYVLESAIQDHRFGENQQIPSMVPKEMPVQHEEIEAPRYEAVPVETLPSLNRLRTIETKPSVQELEPTPEEEKESRETVQVEENPTEIKEDTTEDLAEETASISGNGLHDSWKTWFDTPSAMGDMITEVSQIPTAKDFQNEVEDVNIPIHIVSQYAVEAPSVKTLSDTSTRTFQKPSSRVVAWLIGIVGICIAGFSLTVVALGSGYFDTFAISHIHVRALSGISVYNK